MKPGESKDYIVTNPAPKQPAFPRAAPFRPPEDLAAQTLRLRRWTLLLIGGAALALLLTIGTGLFFLNRMSHQLQEAAANHQAPPTSAPEQKRYIPPASLADRSSPPPPADNASSVVKDTKKTENDPEDKTQSLLAVVGILTKSHLYQSHLNIGLLHDGYENGIYDRQEAEGLLRSILKQVDGLEQELTYIGDLVTEPRGKLALALAHELTRLLRTQGTDLHAYWEKGDETLAKKYLEDREETAKRLQELHIDD